MARCWRYAAWVCCGAPLWFWGVVAWKIGVSFLEGMLHLEWGWCAYTYLFLRGVSLGTSCGLLARVGTGWWMYLNPGSWEYYGKVIIKVGLGPGAESCEYVFRRDGCEYAGTLTQCFTELLLVSKLLESAL